MLGLLIAAALAAAPGDTSLNEAAHAIDAGRLDQARAMVAKAVADGATGQRVERLLADFAYASGNYDEALIRYEALIAQSLADPVIAERAGIAAIKTGAIAKAVAHIGRVTALPGASWRAWNAAGVIADLRQQWPAADDAYAHAAALAPDRPEIANNRGWSQLMRGNWAAAIPPLETAATLDPKSSRIHDNLELARSAVADRLPQRLAGESAQAWSARLNDAGVIARVRGDSARAIAAFAQAIEARETWYERAANNLQSIEARK